eukprot:10854999-Lingulodinium_polyedra.AAC.1
MAELRFTALERQTIPLLGHAQGCQGHLPGNQTPGSTHGNNARPLVDQQTPRGGKHRRTLRPAARWPARR